MTLALRYAARSDRGLIRNNNQDSVYAGPRLLAIADGMGGHAGGEIASNVVISVLAHLDEDRPYDDLISALRAATADANEHLRGMAAQDPQLEGMGTTLTALLFAGPRVGLCTSETPGPTCCAATSSSRSPTTTRSCRRWWTRAG